MGPAQKALIGVWRSDRRRTLQFCHWYHTLPAPKKRWFASLFGRLELRYTRRSVYHMLPGFRYRSTYEVIAEEEESIVIRFRSEDLKRQINNAVGPGFDQLYQPKLQQITFRRHRGRQYYWVGSGMYCEWFRKRESRQIAGKPRRPSRQRSGVKSQRRGSRSTG